MPTHHDEFKKNWRLHTGVSDRPGARVPPPTEWSGSEGDRKRFSFRPSDYPRFWQNAVCNDDGSPVMAETNALLLDLLEVFRAIRVQNEAAIAALNGGSAS